MEYKGTIQPEMKLKEVLAAVINGGRKVILWGLVFAILLGLYGVVTGYVLTGEPDQEYVLAMEEYEMSLQKLQDSVERSSRDLESQKIYNENSLLMKVDPYNKNVTTVVFAVSNIDTSEAKGTYGAYETPDSYITGRIVAQYKALWDGMDLERLVEGTGYADVDDKYLREVISLTVLDGGVLQLSVIGKDGQESEKVASGVYQAVADNKSSIEKGSYSHELVLLHDVFTKIVVDQELETKQQDNIGKAEKYQQEIVDAQKALLILAPPSEDTGIGSVVKKAVLGGMIGAVLGVVWLAVMQVLQNKLTGANQMLDSFQVVYLGSVAKSGSLWSRMARGMLNEKSWKDASRAGAYIRENCVARIPENGTVALVTSIPAREESLLADAVQAVSLQGCKVIPVTDANHDPKAVSAIRECDGVVLAERAFESRTAAVADVLMLAENLEKPVFGFVMI